MMIRKAISLIIPVVLFVCFIMPNNGGAQPEVTVSGSVTNRYNQPVPGVTVSLFHPQLGRSAPAVTNSYGSYTIYRVPRNSVPYYIEVYWGQRLIYRYPITVNNHLNWNIQIK